MAARYRLFLREAATLERLDELTDWISFKAVVRFNRAGSWALRISRESPSAALISPTSGIVITRDDATIFSGFVKTYKITAREVQVDGLDDMARLDVPILPDPAGPPYPEQYTSTDTASTVLLQLAHVNVGAGARADRRVFGLSVGTDPNLGADITVRESFAYLLPTMEKLAASAGLPLGLRFTLLQTDTPTTTGIVFSVAEPQDRSDYAQFSVELGTASDFEDVIEAPAANYFYVRGGDALGPDRTIVEGGNLAAIATVGRQIEAVIERRGVTDPAELNQTLAEAIAGSAPARKVTVTPVDEQALEFGPDPDLGYDMGDLVQFHVNGVAYSQVIREVEITLDPKAGARVIPMIGDAGATNDGATLIGKTNLAVRAVAARVDYLEANYNLPPDGVTLPMLAAPVKTPIGEIASFATAGAPVGWVIADGSAISRTTYADLFGVIGTFYGAGNGTTTFNVPDLRNKLIIGSGITYTTGQSGTLPHDAHTHPGTHDHTHQHQFDHDHSTDLDHNHPSFTSGSGAGDTGTHTHSVNPPALGSTIQPTESGSTTPDTTGDNNANAQSTAFVASYSGSNTAYFAALACIYAGV